MRNSLALWLVKFARWMLTKSERGYEWARLNEEAIRVERNIRKSGMKIIVCTVKNFDDEEVSDDEE